MHPTRALWPGVVAAALSGSAFGQVPPHLEQIEVPVHIDSGVLPSPSDGREVIFSRPIFVPDATWIRLQFAPGTTLGRLHGPGERTVVRIMSLTDGAVQTLNATHLRQWQNTSAYFNGRSVLVEIVADPGSDPSRIVIDHVWAGLPGPMPISICGPDDDRLLSSDPRAARVVPVGCTVWLIDDVNHCFLTAGHCTGTSFSIVEFNVPLSDGGGSIVHPPPEDQYAVDPASVQSNGGQGTGDDWAYFGCFSNPVTGLTPFEAQGDFFVLADTPPPVAGQTIRITGYGTTSSPAPPEWNQVQKTHSGPYVTFSGTLVQYQVDTTGGNSGSPVIEESSDIAIGIHTHAGCSLSGGENNGTGINHSGLQTALANPQGVCAPLPLLAFTYPDGLPERIDPSGGAIRVVVSGQNGGAPEPGTGLLHYDDGGGFITVPMLEVSSNTYDAVFPPIACGTTVAYYVSAETTDFQVVADPVTAPSNTYGFVAAVDFDFSFTDDFEIDTGWTIQNAGGLTTGAWDRGIPAGFGDRGDPPTDADGSGQAYVTGLADGDNDIDGGSTTLMSPIIDATGPDPHITYWRWYSNSFGAAPEADIFVVEVSSNGGLGWVALETVGPTGP
ncbi:MAG: trypsin-like serine peptidase, partial [Planctomycetota bacterium]